MTDEDLLAALLARLSDLSANGRAADVEAEIARHPEFATELRKLWGAAQLADVVGRQVTDLGATLPGVLPSTSIPLPAQFGDYELLEEVGRGGMGIVYRARQVSLDREVAIKMLLRGPSASWDDETRFLKEAESAARLDHPRIVPVYEVGQQDGRMFFSMRFIKGQTLASRLRLGAMEPREAATIMAEVAAAVHFAHEKGVLHRDLKPSNILLDAEGHAHVTDFGLARRVSDVDTLTRSGAILGTPAYMSPEQAIGKRGTLGPASDVFSLGTILYEMLTGRPPFQAASAVDTVFQLLEQEVTPPRAVRPSANRELSMVALRCLQKPPDLRYTSAAALAADLHAFLRDEPLSASSGKLTQIVTRWLRETHHAPILHNWGVLWMWHSLVLLVVCLMTQALHLADDQNRWHYSLLWTAGLGAWAAVFWWLRRRMGPVTFVERQIAHCWAAGMISIALLFPVEWMLQLPVLTLSPVVALVSGIVFMVKAGILSGRFYLQAALMFVTSLAMARWPRYGHLIFGFVAAASFFFPGLKYYRERLAEERRLT
jgi:serine/threonine-protein kinase